MMGRSFYRLCYENQNQIITEIAQHNTTRALVESQIKYGTETISSSLKRKYQMTN